MEYQNQNQEDFKGLQDNILQSRGQDFTETKNTSKKQNHPIIYVVIIVVLVLILGFLLYLIFFNKKYEVRSSIAKEQENIVQISKIDSKDYGFYFASTTDWSVESVNNPDSLISYKFTSPDHKNSFEVDVFGDKDPEKMTLGDWARNDIKTLDPNAKSLYEEPLSTSTLKELIGNLGIIYRGTIGGKYYKNVYLIRGIEKYIYKISVLMNENELWKEEFDRLLSTFKLVEIPTAKYYTYNNLQYSYEITYPANWRVKDNISEVVIRNHYNPFLDEFENPKNLEILNMSNKNPKNLNIKDWSEADKFWITYGVKSKEFIKLNSYDAIKINYENNSLYNSKNIIRGYQYLITKDKNVFLLGYSTRNGAPDPVIEKMIQSFNFTSFDKDSYQTQLNKENSQVIGEDKNNDGIWDYVGDYINQKYSFSAKIRSALNQFAKILQQSLLDYRDKELSVKHANEGSRAMNCLQFVISNGQDGQEGIEALRKASDIRKDVEAKLLNNVERIKAYFSYNSQLGGTYTLKEETKGDCDFDPDKLPN